jgi:hypothetical protein
LSRPRSAQADYLVDFVACRLVIPAALLPKQKHAGTRTALIAVVRSGAIAIVEPEPISPAAERAWSMPVAEKFRIDAEQRQDFSPPAASALDGVHVHEAVVAFA